MNAEKSLSSWLSRRNISVAGKADHSVMAFILMVMACSSLSLLQSKSSQGISLAMFQRDFSRSWNRSGYSMGEGLVAWSVFMGESFRDAVQDLSGRREPFYRGCSGAFKA